ncbi:uncharacterized protein A1O9_09453 [Exophiala aquamarina CBS 119918]|uniref:Microsomal epoxide hydrolase n=1 Tax=Exophiala aquamarina CBS 119918 TaxID=1182545 RepID=A0A072P3N7_9EURO|nr:uncharacterized protein A1O9_09453 [Exophiala aquamarina CBS 119918]KEF54287.1 hypothetical protein A1O9_09453 [Exophiala aquamarina CBS 119918]
MMIQAADNGRLFLERTLATWTAKGNLKDFDVAALTCYRDAYCSETRIHTTCEDYRAGAFLDRVYDEEELEMGSKIEKPLLAIWGKTGLFAESMVTQVEGPLEVWQRYAQDVTGKALDCGHFVPEEDPEGLVEALLAFLL